MKNLVLVIFFLTFFVRVIAEEFPGFLMGSRERVMQNAVSKVTDLNIFVSYTDTKIGVTDFGIGKRKFKDEAEINSYFRTKLETISKNLLTNLNVRKNASFTVESFGSTYSSKSGVTHYLYLKSNFRLVKIADGSYHLPDFSGIKFGFPAEIGYSVPSLVWARVEISDLGGNTIQVFDSSENTSEVVDMENSSLFIPSDYSLSGTNGPTRIRISLITGVGSDIKFQVFDGMGQPSLEKQPTLAFLETATSPKGAKPAASGPSPITNLRVSGGEIGRTYEVQGSESIEGPWTTLSGVRLTVWSKNDNSISYYNESLNRDQIFYRLQTVEVVPVK